MVPPWNSAIRRATYSPSPRCGVPAPLRFAHRDHRLEQARRASPRAAAGPGWRRVSTAAPADSSSATRTGSPAAREVDRVLHQLVEQLGGKVGRAFHLDLAPRAAARARTRPADRRGGSLRRSRAPPRPRSKRSRSTVRRLCSRRDASVMRSRMRLSRAKPCSARSMYRAAPRPARASGSRATSAPRRSACAARATGARPCSRGRRGAARGARAPPRSCATGRRSRRRASEPAASRDDAAARVDRRLGFVAQPPDAHGEPRGECHQQHAGAGERGERQQQQALERRAPHRHRRIRGLLGHHGAGHLVADPDRMRRRNHDRAAVAGVAGARRRRALQRGRDLRRRWRARPPGAIRRSPRSAAGSASRRAAATRAPRCDTSTGRRRLPAEAITW